MPVLRVKHDDKNSPETAQSAIEAYYDDLLASMLDDSLSCREQTELVERSAKPLPHKTSVATEPSKPNLMLSRPQRPEVPAKTTLFQASRAPDVLAPVVIPAAFPKLAPVTPVASANLGQTHATEVRTEVAPKELKTVVSETVPSTVANTVADKVAETMPETARSAQQRAPDSVVGKSKPAAEPVADSKPQTWMENGRPAWGQRRFECLLFTVAGLKLAVPLVSLGSIYKIDKDLTPLVGRADWFMGLYRSGERNVQVIDTARWVMPDRWSEQCRKNYHFIIRIGGNNWGMACDAVEQAVHLEPSQVKWRTERSKRPWLSGTVIDYMCALLDAETMGYLLQRQAKLRGLPFST